MNSSRVIALVFGSMLHLIALFLLVHQEFVLLALVLHFGGSAAWGWGASIFLPPAQITAWWLPGTCALMFPVGGLIASLGLVRVLREKPADTTAQRYLVWNDQPQAEWSPTLPAGAPGLSIVEILQSPRTQLRRNAVLALRELDPQLAIPLLRKGLQDSDEQVRIYAQNILSAMLERFEAGIKEHEQHLAANAESAVRAVNLAEQYFELVYLDVAGDEETAAHYLSKSLALLERASLIEPNDSRVAFLGLKYALRARDVAAARKWLQRTEQCGLDPQQVLPWRMELTFLEGNWPQLRAQFTTFGQSGYVNKRIEDLAAFWMQPQPAGS